MNLDRALPSSCLYLVRVFERALQNLHKEECGIIHTLAEYQLHNDYLMSKTFTLIDVDAANMMSNCFVEMVQPQSLRSQR